jgi:ubiquitin-conjugating enzyme E2 J2
MSIPLKCKKRLIGEIKLLKKDPHDYIDICPDDKDMLTWYFLIKAPQNSDYAGGYYIGKLLYPKEYPDKPPDYMMLTPSGRYNINDKICLSNSGFHENEWSKMWTIHATLTGFLSIMLDDTEHGLAHIRASKEERKKMAMESVEYNKTHYPELVKLFSRFLDNDGNPIINSPSSTEKPGLKNPNINSSSSTETPGPKN